MSQRKIEDLLRSEDAVPDGDISEGSTKSTPAVKLTRLRKKFAHEGSNDTIPHIQCYRLEKRPKRPLPEGLKGSPVLYKFATTLMRSTALSIDQLSESVWGRPAESNVTNAVSRLKHGWGLNIVSTGYHGIRTKPGGHQPSAIPASTATAQPEVRPISLAKVSLPWCPNDSSN